jgi:hypothetical protein
MVGAFGCWVSPERQSRVSPSQIIEYRQRLDAFRLAARHGGYSPGSDTAALLVGDRRIELEWDAPHPNIRRPWFRCPQCDRRCRYVFPPEFGCISCLKLDNACRYSPTPTIYKVLRLRRQLGLEETPFAPIPKRKRHWTRYNRVREKILAAEDEMIGGLRRVNRDLLRRARLRGMILK